MRGRRLLLISPAFHGYWQAIATSLESRGHTVATHIYDSHTTFADRTWRQLRHELPHRMGVGNHRALAASHTAGACVSVRDAAPEVVVIVKGDTLGADFWDEIAALPRVTWLYDEVRRTRFEHTTLARIGPIATYSPMDDAAFRAAGLDSRYLPLAFDHRLQTASTRSHDTEITFVGARYPNREAVMLHLYNAGIPVRAFGRDWSGHPLDRLRTWRIAGPGVPSERDLTRVAAYDAMAASAATLNVHGDQDGFTMRTFEAAGVGGVELVDRTDVEALYDPGREVLTWTTSEELTELCRRALVDTAWTDGIRSAARARTLAQHTFDQRVAVLEDAWDTV